MIEVNSRTGNREFLISAILKTISSEDKFLKNKMKVSHKKVTADLTYPNGIKATVSAILCISLFEANPYAYRIGETITLAIQIDGDHAGNATVVLEPITTFDPAMYVSVEVATEENLNEIGSSEFFEPTGTSTASYVEETRGDDNSKDSENLMGTFYEDEKYSQIEKKSQEKSNISIILLISFLIGLLLVTFVWSTVIKEISEFLDRIPWYINIVLTVSGFYLFIKIMEWNK